MFRSSCLTQRLAIALGALVAGAACGSRAEPLAKRDPAIATSAAAASSSGASKAAANSAASHATEAPPAERPIPSWALVPLASGSAAPPRELRLYPVTGAVVVADAQRVGRIVGESVEWIGKIPAATAISPTLIREVSGTYPDSIDVQYQNIQGRAPEPSYIPLTGKGKKIIIGEGGGWGSVHGVVQLGESTVASTSSMLGGAQHYTVRGPAVKRLHLTPAAAGCKPGEVQSGPGFPASPGVSPIAVTSTEAGTLLSFGKLCEKRGPAAEIWDSDGKARVVELSSWIKDLDISPIFVRGKGDEAWLMLERRAPILHYKDGAFTPLPALGGPVHNLFLSAKGELVANDGTTLSRLDAGAWVPLARLDWGGSFDAVVADGETLWASSGGVVGRLRETTSTRWRADCETPFVHLSEVDYRNDAKFTFPTTRKALSSFAETDGIALVEHVALARRRLGVSVKSGAQGEALIAHVKPLLKGDQPRLLCYVPQEPRVIPLTK